MGIEKKSAKDDAKTPKPKRTMSEAQKEALAKGRAKAHERMRGLKTEKEEIKSLKQKVAIKSVDEEEGEISPLPPKQIKQKSKKVIPPVVIPPVNISDSESSSEEEEETSPPPKQIKDKKKGKSTKIIEKHYYHDKPTPAPPPPPPPPPATPAPTAPAKKKINFR